MATHPDDRAGAYAGERPRRGDERSIGALFADLSRETADLVRNQIDLAKAEMSRKIDNLQAGLVSMAIGGAVLLLGAVALLIAAIGALDDLLDRWWETNWLSPLIVALVVLAVGYMLLRSGQSKMTADNLVPRRTIDSFRRDAEFAREQVR